MLQSAHSVPTPSGSEPLPPAWADWRQLTPPSWLVDALKPDKVRESLARYVPEFAAGTLRLTHFETKRLRLREDNQGWWGTFLLSVEGLQPGHQQVVPMRGTVVALGADALSAGVDGGAFGTPTWHCYLPDLHLDMRPLPTDSELFALPQLVDGAEARIWLEEQIRASAPLYATMQIEQCLATVLRYKPGNRATVRYDVTYATTSPSERPWPAPIFAKTYKGDKGQKIYEIMQALWRSPLGQSKMVAIAEPLAYVPALGALVQGPVVHDTTLKALVRASFDQNSAETTTQLKAYLRKAAAGLAELHHCGVQLGKKVTWETAFAEVIERREAVSAILPQLSTLAAPVLKRLTVLAEQYPAEQALPAHRSFDPAQVLAGQGDVAFIDFDNFCQAEPAMDVASFLSSLRQLSFLKPPHYLYRAWLDDFAGQSGESAPTAVPPTSLESEGEDDDSWSVDPDTRLRRLKQADEYCAIFLDEYEKHAPISRPRVVLWETAQLLSDVVNSWAKLKFARLDNCMFLLECYLILQQVMSDVVDLI